MQISGLHCPRQTDGVMPARCWPATLACNGKGATARTTVNSVATADFGIITVFPNKRKLSFKPVFFPIFGDSSWQKPLCVLQ